MSEEITETSPDKLVEAKILSAFANEGICDVQALKELGNKISSGTLKDVDWSLIFENLVEREEKIVSEQNNED